ncbi:MAG: response regulator transcription factor [Gemmatimonadaceae bacterium]|nr:response regulator transcription factor [Gemmatimonadaceae bacterium]
MPIRLVLLGDHAATLHTMIASQAPGLDVQVIGVHANRLAAERALRDDCPDAALVSSHFHDGSGFAVVAAMAPATRPTAIVFFSAREQDAVRAFELQATDFVPTPVRPMRLRDAMIRVRHQVVQAAVLRTADELQRLLGDTAIMDVTAGQVARGPVASGDSSSAESVLDLASVSADRRGDPPMHAERPSRVLVREGRRTHFVPIQTVDWFEADGNYIVVHAGRETFRTRGTITALETVLDGRQFARIHRRMVVNMDRVREMTPLPGGDGMLTLGDGSTLRLSRTYRARVK